MVGRDRLAALPVAPSVAYDLHGTPAWRRQKSRCSIAAAARRSSSVRRPPGPPSLRCPRCSPASGCARAAHKKTPPGGFPPGGAHWPKSGNRSPFDLLTVNSLRGNRPDRLRLRGGGIGSRLGSRGTARTARRLRTAGRLAAAVAGRAVGLTTAAAGAAAALASVLGLQRRDHLAERVVLLPNTAARGCTAAGLAAASTGVASGLSATIASVARRFAAAVSGVASGLSAAAAAATIPLALREQTLQTTEQIMLAGLPGTAAASTGVAGRLAAAVAGVASGFCTTVASTTSRLAAAIASTGIAAGLAATSTGVAAGLTARSTALVAEHPVKELETEGLATNGNAKNQRTEIHHTLHRATSPLLMNHRCARPACDAVTPRL